MAEKSGYAVEAEERGDGIYLHITGTGAAPQEQAPQPAQGPTSGALVLVVSSETMGRGEHAELGHVLVRGFFHALGEVAPVPDAIIFFNSGVKLVVEGSAVLEDLRALADRGIEILACGTCLEYYALTDQIAVGEISNMYTIAETILGASRVVNL
jgi:selenium metabolism protein YedF